MNANPNFRRQIAYNEPIADLKPQFDITAVVDGAFHIFCSQIAENYIQILRKHVLPNISRKESLGLRELRVLNCVFRFTGEMKSADVVAIMNYDPATVSRAIKRLCDEGMITKLNSEHDARSSVLKLTEKGEGLAKEYRGKALLAYELLSENVHIDISREEMEVFLSVAEKVRDRTTAMRKRRVQRPGKYAEDLENNYTNVLKMGSV